MGQVGAFVSKQHGPRAQETLNFHGAGTAKKNGPLTAIFVILPHEQTPQTHLKPPTPRACGLLHLS